MKISIIGANSYIARNVIYCSKDYGNLDLCLYDLGEKQVDGEKNYKSINILDKEAIKIIDMNCDVIFLFAGKTGSTNGFEEYENFIDINEKGLLNILNEYRRQKSRAKIVFPSTRLVYKGKKGLLPEDSEKEFKTVYAMNKYACENYLEQYHNVFGVNYCIFRIGIPYGTLIPEAASYGTTEFMLSKALKGENINLYGKGEVRRTLTYIGDLCRILIEGALNDTCKNDIYNIGGEDCSLSEMAELIANKYNVLVKYIDYPEVAKKIESGDTVFDSRKLDEILNLDYQQTFELWCSKEL